MSRSHFIEGLVTGVCAWFFFSAIVDYSGLIAILNGLYPDLWLYFLSSIELGFVMIAVVFIFLGDEIDHAFD